MTKQDFLEQLQKALGSRVSSSIVNENIAYYEEYIAMQVRAGKSEEADTPVLNAPFSSLIRSIISVPSGYVIVFGVRRI